MLPLQTEASWFFGLVQFYKTELYHVARSKHIDAVWSNAANYVLLDF